MNKKFWKTVLSCVLAVMTLLSMTVSVFALTPVADLPVVQKWVNGAALAEDGSYLHDTWTVDKSGVSDYGYVLVNQESSEEFRVKSYPDDVSAGKTTTVEKQKVTIKLNVPKSVTEEVILTLESAGAVNSVSFVKESDYRAVFEFYPGEYKVTGVDVPVSTDVTHTLAENKVVKVGKGDVFVSYTIVETGNNSGTGDGDGDNGGDGKTSVNDNPSAAEIVSGFDSNGDLLGDTVKLVVAVIILFAVYGVIKYRRKKKEEINR